ncbi:hypothetical protein ASZ90_001617 [hydrocarbon metagenome]|uniref:Type I restriction enzyme R protein N-terminal domain-containing protein n=1 Tax=hydrocarbon metagenome TaxID=938273 RepID=A0A0W8G636_9ZZZZ
MHEESLNRVIRDYLTGEDVEETSYEEFRQALARLLVEERGYPKDRMCAKVGVCFPVEGQDYTRMVDLVVADAGGAPLLVVIFCSGEPGSYIRETLAASRLYGDAPVPLALITDTKEALFLRVADGHILARGGMRTIPHYDELVALAAASPAPPLAEDAKDRERRILFAYSEFLSGGCCAGACRPAAKKI